MGIIAPLSSTAVLAAIPAGGITAEKMAAESTVTAGIAARAVTSPKLAEIIEITKGLGMFAKSPPAAQPAAVPVPAFVTGASGLSTEAKVKELVEAVEKIVKLLKEYGLTA